MTGTEQPHEIVWRLSTAGSGARCIHIVADLGVADRIGDSPVPVTDLAASCAVNADALDRVLRLLAAHGVFKNQQDGYGHTLLAAASRRPSHVSGPSPG